MNVSRLLRGLLAASIAAFAVGASAQANDKPLKIGVTAGPHAQIFEVVKKIAEKDGLKIQVVEFSDYVQPNAALAAGDLDANSYQHQPYLDNTVKDRGYKIVSIAQTIVFPMGIYSKKVKSLADLKSGARVALPNDPTNGGRALLILQSAGLIGLKDGGNITSTVQDVEKNDKHLQFVELEAAQIPRSIDDVDIALINTNFAMEAGLNPLKDALFLEPKDSPYANVLVIREGDENRPEIQKLVKALQSPDRKSTRLNSSH